MVFKSVVVCMEISRVHLCFQVGDFCCSWKWFSENMKEYLKKFQVCIVGYIRFHMDM